MPAMTAEGLAAESIVQAFSENAVGIPERPALRRYTPAGWERWSWRDYVQRAREVTAGLAELGLAPGDHVAIFSNNRLEWHLADLGTLGLGAVVVPLYQTSAADQVAYLLDNSESRACFVEDPELLGRILEVRDRLPKLERVVVFEGGTSLDDPFLIGFDELCALGTQALARQPSLAQQLAAAVRPEDVATLVYTSGTTGPPKGAVVTHANVMWVLRSAVPFIHARSGERFLSFLPLSHVAERMISDFAAIVVGGETWFARSLSTVPDDLRACRPTIFFAVPRVWEKLQEAVLEDVARRPPALRVVIERYLALGRRSVARRQLGRPEPWWETAARTGLDAVIGSRIRHQLGLDAAHVLASSAAPIHPDLLVWLHGTGLEVIELYGQTEACGPTTCNPPEDIRIGTVGVALPGVEVAIAADGEVLVRGGNVCRGYFSDSEASHELIDEEGWMHSGDTGILDAAGYLTITGRKKDLIITAAGQNISPQEIEADLRNNGLVSEAVVIGDGRRYLTALLTLDEEAVLSWARRHGKVTDYEELTCDPDVHAEMDRIVAAVNATRSRVENVRRYRVLPHEFTLASGEFTPTYKVKRHRVMQRYRELVEEMYAEG